MNDEFLGHTGMLTEKQSLLPRGATHATHTTADVPMTRELSSSLLESFGPFPQSNATKTWLSTSGVGAGAFPGNVE